MALKGDLKFDRTAAMTVVANPGLSQSKAFLLARLSTHLMWAPRPCNGRGFDRFRIESRQMGLGSNPFSILYRMQSVKLEVEQRMVW